MMHRHMWRRFKPHGVVTKIAKWPRTDVWRQAAKRVDDMFPGRQLRDDAIARAIQSARDQAGETEDPVLWCVALILQAPQAAIAQAQIDQHPNNYRYKRERLYELIDFNDSFVSAVLAMPEEELATFSDEAKRAMDLFCRRVRVRCFSNDQFEAITHGLSREIALYRGATAEGFGVRMTSKIDDALGIDMVITDTQTGREINVDCKTHSSFYYRIKDLMHEGRLTAEQAAAAEDSGYCWEVNGDELRRERIVLLRLDQQTYGNIHNFSFENTVVLGQQLAKIMTTTVNETAAVY